jgi:amino acid adenylation domain-containing protein
MKRDPSIFRFPLSYGQRALWHIQNLMPESSVYNVSIAWQILSELDIPALQRTFQMLVDRHPSLRTTYTVVDGNPVQEVHHRQKVHFKILPSSDWSEDEFERELGKEAHRPFDLEKGPPMRITLFLRESASHILLVSFHHIAVDMWASTIIFEEISALYPAAREEVIVPSPISDVRYSDYVQWQKNLLEGPEGQRLWDYWRNRFPPELKPMELPFQLRHSSQQRFVGAAQPFKLDRTLTFRLRQLARRHHVTLYIILLSGFQALLHLYTSRDIFLIRSLAVGRSRAEFEKVIGFFANPVVLKGDFRGLPTFADVLSRVEKDVAQMIEHQDFPFELLMEKLRFGKDVPYNPNPEIMFILQTPQRFLSVRKGQAEFSSRGIFSQGRTGIRLNLGGLIVEKFNPKQLVTLNDLAVEMAEVGSELSGVIHYRTDLFAPQGIVEMTEHFKKLLDFMWQNIEQPISSFKSALTWAESMSGTKRRDRMVPSRSPSVSLPRVDIAPRNETEKILIDLLEEILDLKKVSVFADFFELGGTSLQALQLITQVREIFKVDLPLRELFEAPTAAGLAEVISQAEQFPSAPPLEPVVRKEKMGLSFSQERIWFIDRLMEGKASYNIPAAVKVKGNLDLRLVKECAETIVKNQEVLRSTFSQEEGNPYVSIHSHFDLRVPVNDISHLAPEDQKKEIERTAKKEAQRRFDLEKGPLFRLIFLKLAPKSHIAFLIMHHIVSDGWSLNLFLRDFALLYEAALQKKNPSLPERSIQYVDIANWQRQRFQGKNLEKRLSFWREKLADLPTVNLPGDRPRPNLQKFEGRSHSLKLSASLTEALKKLSGAQGATQFMILLSAFKVLLFRYTQQEDIAVGSPTAGRDRIESEDLIGCFINLLVLRTDLSGDPSFLQLLHRVREVCLNGYAHQDVPFEMIVGDLQPHRDLSREPLFQVMFAFQDVQTPSQQIPGGPSLEILNFDWGITRYDLTLFAAESKKGLRLVFEYNKSLFERSTIERLSRHFVNILRSVVANPHQKISETPLMSEKEAGRILVKWNETQKDYPEEACVQDLIEAQVIRKPESIAVESDGNKMTFTELDQKANRLAHHLVSVGAGPDVPVGVFMERSLDSIVGILGILKSGAAFVPLDPSFPLRRTLLVFRDAKMPILLTSASSSKLLDDRSVVSCAGFPRNVIDLEKIENSLQRHKNEPPEKKVRPDNLAYVIYTSGSTGQPKGAMVPHRALVNYLNWCCEAYSGFRGQGSVLYSSLSFDFSMTSLFGPLVSGGTLCLAPSGPDGELLAEGKHFRRGQSFLKLTPQHAQVLGEQLKEGSFAFPRVLVLGGEELKPAHIEAWKKFRPRTVLYNEYGPTEATVGCCVYKIPKDIQEAPRIPIGRPINNVRLYILDKNLRPVPVGVSGQLYIGGLCLARGYLNRPDLTAENFIDDPFSSSTGTKLFRTGDLARYLARGDIDFLGRLDDQVKIRGFRIESGEIETALKSHAAISQAAILVRPDKTGGKTLIACLVGKGELKAEDREIRQHLLGRIPDFMIPKYFLWLESLPLAESGKLDRRSLARFVPQKVEPIRKTQPLETSIEKEVAKIWREVLGVDQTGKNDNFFELGGHSLQALRMVSMANKRFRVDLPVISLFQAQTISEFSRRIEEILKTKDVPEKAADRKAVLVPLRNQGKKNPLFIFHPSGGGVSVYRQLVKKLASGFPVFGVQSRALFDAADEYDSLASMAEDYARLLLNKSDGHVYDLLGWSFGGCVAFSVARVLEEAGKKVCFLGLLDPSFPNVGHQWEPQQSWEWMKMVVFGIAESLPESVRVDKPSFSKIGKEWHELVNASSEFDANTVPDWLVKKKFVNPDYRESIKGTIALAQKHHRLVQSVSHFPVQADIHIWFPRRKETEIRLANKQMARLTQGKVTLYQTAGHHFSMLDAPNVTAIARKIGTIIDALHKTGSSHS